MADDENAYVPKTFEELFKIYANFKLDPLDVDNEVYDSILLTQIDLWLDKSELLKTVFSTTDTGLAWMKFKKWRLDYNEFVTFLKNLCAEKDVEYDMIKEQMTEAGVPTSEVETTVVVK